MSFWDKLMGAQNQQEKQQDPPLYSQEDLAWDSLANSQMRNATAAEIAARQNAFGMAHEKIEGSAMNFMSGIAGQKFTATVNPDSMPLHRMTMDDLKGEAATTTLENLSNLWQARWRSQWVRRSEIDGEFYNIAATRLNAAHMLEAHQLADGTQVYRLIERT